MKSRGQGRLEFSHLLCAADAETRRVFSCALLLVLFDLCAGPGLPYAPLPLLSEAIACSWQQHPPPSSPPRPPFPSRLPVRRRRHTQPLAGARRVHVLCYRKNGRRVLCSRRVVLATTSNVELIPPHPRRPWRKHEEH
ncbi:unnamed protein product [Ectocarpus sp. 12 AP-2014]